MSFMWAAHHLLLIDIYILHSPNTYTSIHKHTHTLLNLFINSHTYICKCLRAQACSQSLLCLQMQFHPAYKCYRTKKKKIQFYASIFFETTKNHTKYIKNWTNEQNKFKVNEISQEKCTIFSGVSWSKDFSLLFCSFLHKIVVCFFN